MNGVARPGCAVGLALLLTGCGGGGPSQPSGPAPRTFRMGFSGIPPRNDENTIIAAIDLWSRRADAAILSLEPPWSDLLRGVPPETYVTVVYVPLVNYYRSKGHRIWVYLDPGNGLNRGGESDGLVNAGRSIEEPEIQQLYRHFAVAMDTLLRPEHMGVALETNLIRGASPPALYAAIRQVANDAAADVRAVDPAVILSVSVQVDFAWGHFDGSGFKGVAADFADFPFLQELGLSSYPYLAGYTDPNQIPNDYYTRLVEGRQLPTMVTEGGWTSASLGGIVSSPETQSRWILRQAQLLDTARAIAVFQLTFTDLDLAAFPQPPGSALPLFAWLGLVDVNLNPKPALTAWDQVFARPLR
jgi:hypothetical protein